jgi:hypothetical protein
MSDNAEHVRALKQIRERGFLHSEDFEKLDAAILALSPAAAGDGVLRKALDYLGDSPCSETMWAAAVATLRSALSQPQGVVGDEMVERAIDAMHSSPFGSIESAVRAAFCSHAQLIAAVSAWNNVYDAEIHGDGSRTDNREDAMRAALTAALHPPTREGQPDGR